VAFLIDILEDPDYGKGAWRLLVYIATKLDYDSLEVFLVPEIVAKDMGVTRQAVYNWLSVLLKKGVLEKRATHLYRLRPYTVIKGQVSKATETEPDF
jgi:DNA-binding MarR family transcriptional regulator